MHLYIKENSIDMKRVKVFSLVIAEVITKVKGTDSPYFRPTTLQVIESEVHKVQEKVVQLYKDLMEICWSEDPAARPTFSSIKQSMVKLYQNK